MQENNISLVWLVFMLVISFCYYNCNYIFLKHLITQQTVGLYSQFGSTLYRLVTSRLNGYSVGLLTSLTGCFVRRIFDSMSMFIFGNAALEQKIQNHPVNPPVKHNISTEGPTNAYPMQL